LRGSMNRRERCGRRSCCCLRSWALRLVCGDGWLDAAWMPCRMGRRKRSAGGCVHGGRGRGRCCCLALGELGGLHRRGQRRMGSCQVRRGRLRTRGGLKHRSRGNWPHRSLGSMSLALLMLCLCLCLYEWRHRNPSARGYRYRSQGWSILFRCLKRKRWGTLDVLRMRQARMLVWNSAWGNSSDRLCVRRLCRRLGGLLATRMGRLMLRRRLHSSHGRLMRRRPCYWRGVRGTGGRNWCLMRAVRRLPFQSARSLRLLVRLQLRLLRLWRRFGYRTLTLPKGFWSLQAVHRSRLGSHLGSSRGRWWRRKALGRLRMLESRGGDGWSPSDIARSRGRGRYRRSRG
jgi:hypothetical protein